MAEEIDNNPIYRIENYRFGEVRGNELYCWNENQPIIIVDVLTGNIIREIPINSRLKADDFRYLGGGCGYGGMNVQIDPKGRYILIYNLSLSPTYSLYDLVRNDWLTYQYLNNGQGHIGSNPFSSDGKLIGFHISTDWDEDEIKFGIYNIESGEELNRVKGRFDRPVKDDYTDGDEHFFNISDNDTSCVFGFDFDPDYNFHILYKKYADECYSIIKNAFFCRKSNNEEYCIVDGVDGSGIVLHRKKILGSLSLDTTMYDYMQFVAVFSNTDNYLATVQANKDVAIHKLPSLAIVKRLSAHKEKESNINLIGFSQDDSLFVYSDGNNIISVDIRNKTDMIDISSKFPSLESAHHLAYYFPSSHGRESDTISSHILKFKDNQEPIVSKWIDLVINEVESLPLVDFIVRVLGSNETSASGNTSLDKLGQAIAEATDAKYCPTWVEKTRQTQQLKFMGKVARQEELDGVFTFSIKGEKRGNPRLNKGGKRFIKIMIIDDVTTTGSTIKEIYRTIHKKYPKCPVHAFVLGKTFDSWVDGEANNNHFLKRFNDDSSDWDGPEGVEIQVTSEGKREYVPKKGFSWKYPNNPNDLSTIKDDNSHSDDLPF